MTWLAAARHRLSPLFPDCFQLELPETCEMHTLNLTDATLLRVAAHAGSAEDLLLRFADAGRCPPEQGRSALERGIEQGWLRTWAAQDFGWPADALPSATSWLGTTEPPERISSAVTQSPCLVAEHLDGIARPAAGTAPGSAHLLSDQLTAILAARGQAEPAAVLCSARSLSQLGSRAAPSLLHFSAHLPLPGAVLSSPAAQSDPDECLLFNRDHPAALRAMACGPLAAPVLRLLDPAARCLNLPVEHAVSLTSSGAALARLAVLSCQLPEAELTLAGRTRLLALLLEGLSQYEDAALRRHLQAAWLRRWNDIANWQQVYGLDAADPGNLPLPEDAELELLREHLSPCARQLRQAA